jgi:gliding motility-associated-like protein
MQANYNCPGATLLSSDTVSNQNPNTPQIVNVTVTADGHVVFNWLPGTSPQTYAYVLYYSLSNGHTVPFDTIYGRLNTTATDTVANPTLQSVSYTIAAEDSCYKISSFNTFPHNTIYTTASITQCQRQINIAWNRYINWPQGVGQYQLWVSKNGNPFTLSGTTDTSTLVYTYTDFNDGDSVSLFIRAVSAGDTNIVSDGNLIHMKARIVQPPSYNYITNATVDLSNHISVTWTIDTIAQLIFYNINRGVDTLTFSSIGQIPAPSPLTHFETLIDSDYLSPQNNPYFYKIIAVDSCQTQYPSPYVETVNLKGELYDYYVAHVTWNDFVLQYTTVKKYNLYRDFGNGFQLIKTFSPGVNEYYDSLQQFLSQKGTFCYRIEAVYDISLPAPSNYKATLSSFSNQVCVIHRPIIYIPNAFAPAGVNNVFKPTIIYGNPQGYTMIIYNRWGGKVFESNDPALGWDGTENGKESQMGGYAYLIQFYADDGTQVERKGIVLLVR